MLKYTEGTHIDPQLSISPFWVNSLADVSPEHTHDFYEFFVISEGSCRHVVNGFHQLLKAGCLVFIRPSDVHRYEAEGTDDCRFYNIPLRSGLVKEAFDYLSEQAYMNGLLHSASPPVALLSPIEVASFIASFERFLMLSTLNTTKAGIYAKGILIEILTNYFLLPEQAEETFIPHWLEQALAKLQQQDYLNRGLQALYDLSGKSPGHVNRAFRQYLQQTPTEYINQLKLNRARNLLLTTEHRVIEIALEAGFDNVSHFYHQFKKFYGQAPLEFRKNAHAQAMREIRGTDAYE